MDLLPSYIMDTQLWSALLVTFSLLFLLLMASCARRSTPKNGAGILRPQFRQTSKLKGKGPRSRPDSNHFILQSDELPAILYFTTRVSDPTSERHHDFIAENFGGEFPEVATELLREVQMHYSTNINCKSPFLTLYSLSALRKRMARYSLDGNQRVFKVDTGQLIMRGGKIIDVRDLREAGLDLIRGHSIQGYRGEFLVWGRIPGRALTATEEDTNGNRADLNEAKRRREEPKVQFNPQTEDIECLFHGVPEWKEENDERAQRCRPRRSIKPTQKLIEAQEIKPKSAEPITPSRSRSKTRRAVLGEKSLNLATPKKSAKPCITATNRETKSYHDIKELLAHKPACCIRGDVKEYLVRWQGGYENSWIRNEDLDAVQLVDQYWAQLGPSRGTEQVTRSQPLRGRR